MNKQQRTMLIALGGMLVVVLLVILVLNLQPNKADPTSTQEPSAVVTASPAPSPAPSPATPTQVPVSEEELGRQAMQEEEGEHWEEFTEGDVTAEEGPID